MQNEKIAIVLWLYHIDLFDEFIDLILPLSKDIKLYLGLCKENDNSTIISNTKLDSIDTIITYHNNCGADVFPFLCQLKIIKESQFIKLHTKKSLLGYRSHIDWRNILVNDLIGSKQIFHNNVSIITKPKTGMITNRAFLLKNAEFKNSSHIEKLCLLMDLDYNKLANGYFPGGNMFMSHTKLFQKYFINNKKLSNLLSNEHGKINDYRTGSYSHAMERIFGYIINNDNLKIKSPKLSTIKVVNKESKKGFFRMVKTYNNSCYLFEDVNIYGNIIYEDNSSIDINWLHQSAPVLQKYHKLSNCSIIKK